jgi:3',5'-cyclic-AMP phosphodiesterase
MPISLPPLSRRGFLSTTLAGTAAALLGRSSFGAEKEIDPNRIFLFSDIHIAADRAASERKTVMFKNLEQACAEILAEEKRASGVLINGDCAYHTGEAGDYATLLDALKPVREGGFPVHLAMGNHDRRDNLWQAFAVKEDARGAVQGRHISVIKTPRANVVMLDSLDKTNLTPGVLGEAQLEWLSKTLDAAADKATIVFVHHHPQDKPKPGETGRVAGITDSEAFLKVVLPRKQVKLLVYGHTHNWEVTRRDDLHCVNLPPVAYVFKEGKPNGWVDLQLQDSGATLQLHCLKKDHAQHLQKVELSWRS